MTQMLLDIKGERLLLEFLKYDAENPHVWELFKRFTFEAIRAGHGNFSAAGIAERIRWETMISTTPINGDAFKLSNNHNAFYARKFHDHFPEHDGFFRTRKSVADKKEPAESLDSAGSQQQQQTTVCAVTTRGD
tara:strand:+ start:451 stop:852 length:402 start_codon:yes stop_codon:yes gene_type:complete